MDITQEKTQEFLREQGIIGDNGTPQGEWAREGNDLPQVVVLGAMIEIHKAFEIIGPVMERVAQLSGKIEAMEANIQSIKAYVDRSKQQQRR